MEINVFSPGGTGECPEVHQNQLQQIRDSRAGT